MEETRLKNFKIDWSKVKTIKDIKIIMELIVTEVVIDFDSPEDVDVYDKLSKYLE